MKVSENTLKLLKNFAGINPSILIRKGSLLVTQSIPGDILAEAQIQEDFPVEFGLYDLTEFLNTLKLFSSPILDFSNADNNYVNICEEDDLSFKVKYTFANKKHITYPKNRPVEEPRDIEFDLDIPTLDSIMKAANVMQLPNMIVLPSTDGNVRIEVSDMKDKSSNCFSIDIKGTIESLTDFSAIFKMDSFKMLPNNYSVSIASSQKSSWESENVDYYIGMHSKSWFKQ